MEIRKTKAEDLIPSHHENYVDTGILGVLDALSWRRPLILKGPKGSGKTLSIEQWAASQGVPMVRQDCSDDITARDLIGSFGVEGDEVYFGCGSVTTAIEIANEEGGCVLVLEEVNALPAKAQKMLNGVCDYRQAVEVAKIGKVFKVKPGHKIWIVGTMNPNYSGTYNLNEDFKSRWGFINVPYMSEEKERKLLLDVFSTPAAAAEKNLVDNLLVLAAASRTGKMGDYALSTRDLVHFIEDYECVGIAKAYKIMEGKYEEEDVEHYRTQIMTLAKINLREVKLIDHG